MGCTVRQAGYLPVDVLCVRLCLQRVVCVAVHDAVDGDGDDGGRTATLLLLVVVRDGVLLTLMAKILSWEGW